MCQVLLTISKPQKGNKTDRKDAKWICDLFMCDMIKPSFIPPPDICHLRDLLRFRMKLTYQITGMKNRALNCLTVSNLKLDDVFTDVFGKSSRSIIQQILDHPGKTFDVKLSIPLDTFPTRIMKRNVRRQPLRRIFVVLQLVEYHQSPSRSCGCSSNS